MKHVLTKPYKFNDVEHTELNIDLENLTTADYKKAERQFKSLNPKFVGVIELESDFQNHIICNVLNQPLDFFDEMPIYEYIQIKTQVQGFLLTGIV